MKTPKLRFRTDLGLAILLLLAILLSLGSAQAGTIKTIASTVPGNGDVNPYGVAVVPTTTGSLIQGNILISNFNNSANLQGTGTTIVQISPGGSVSLFAHVDANHLPGACPGGIGLTTALVALKSGWVVVGSLPTTDGTVSTARAGCLLVLNNKGNVVETFFGSLIKGPWDMTAADFGNRVSLFVTNVLNGTVAANGQIVHQGTVLRLNLTIDEGTIPSLESMTVIGSGLAERTDPAALVIGPTGLDLSRGHTRHDGRDDDDGSILYVADSLNNRIAAIPRALTRTSSAGTGFTVSEGGALNDPLGLTVAPDGNIVTVNGNNGFAVETTPFGHQINKVLLDSSGSPPGAGALFGLAIVNGQGLYFVDDATNTLNLFH
jgi:hypothetical protein